MDNSKLLVIQVLIDVVDDIMREESYNVHTGLWEDQGQNERECKAWHDVFEDIVDAHNATGAWYNLTTAANYGTDYYALKNAVRQKVNDFIKEKGGQK